ncbi:8-oxo-dGTP diphosphatase [Gillisia sp. Hel1_33_143]|uniref:NUDIX domain-containing protein n=1 Tax=Gillisia sp. Hel1_33_143 TaxID=1336796 RepID=UPI00087B09F8|nr:NUDIX hydrolase [Gillisia sp. Hel1_33_143]SDS52820.1 8-oxo-dGTP diphosphatase [Gillisia sp. Hel1_33_143]
MRPQNIAITVDTVIFYKIDKALKLLLIQRKNSPFKEKWALPGGFLEEGETLVNAAARELEEETGLTNVNLIQMEAYGAIGRDPRGRTISIAFMGLLDKEEIVAGADDAMNAKWFDIRNLPELAFDHAEILDAALSRL